MEHLDILNGHGHRGRNGKTLQRRATGKFYTHELIGRHMATEIAGRLPRGNVLTAVDPFCGDGRLLAWLLEAAADAGVRPRWEIAAWDCDADAVADAVARLEATAARLGLSIHVAPYVGDTFARAAESTWMNRYDVVVTNPPWELLKPDVREMDGMPPDVRDDYVSQLRLFDQRLKDVYPHAQPTRRFAGWGTNLARVGTDAAARLVADGGLCGVVSPASLLADSNSSQLRARLFEDFGFEDIAYFPAEARLFDRVDVPCITFVATRRETSEHAVTLTRFGPAREVIDRDRLHLTPARLRELDFVIPASHGAAGARLLGQLASFPRFSLLESSAPDGLWAGRELDETRKERYLCSESPHPFVKGVNVQRFAATQTLSGFVDPCSRDLPKSVVHPRLAWRDVSRPNQKRRVQATLIPAGWVTGNSVSVAYFRDDNLLRLAALLALMSSIPFEYQLRAILSTGHVSLSAVRSVHLPPLTPKLVDELAPLSLAALDGDGTAQLRLETAAARAYGLERHDWQTMLEAFPKISIAERDQMLEVAA